MVHRPNKTVENGTFNKGIVEKRDSWKRNIWPKKELQSVLQDLGAEQTWKEEASSCHEDLVNATARLDLIYEQLLSSKEEESNFENEKKELQRVLQADNDRRGHYVVFIIYEGTLISF